MYKKITDRAKELVKRQRLGEYPKELKAGVSFSFFKIDEETGFKFAHHFRKKKERDITYERQKKAAKHNLAPPVYRKLSFRYGGKTYYGFITGLAKQTNRQIPYKQLCKLEDDLEDIGIYHEDICEPNVGKYKGKLVCLDFDRASVRGRA